VPTADEMRRKIEAGPMFDMSILEHHFTPYLRDYDIIVESYAADPRGTGSYAEGLYRYRFDHCPLVHVETAVSDESWKVSWDDHFTDHDAWRAAGEPSGYVWGVNYSDAYPGPKYIHDSSLAAEWSRRLGKLMHEVVIETNGHNVRIIFHDVSIRKIARGDPRTRELEPLE
jgi:hypothetical protein